MYCIFILCTNFFKFITFIVYFNEINSKKVLKSNDMKFNPIRNPTRSEIKHDKKNSIRPDLTRNNPKPETTRYHMTWNPTQTQNWKWSKLIRIWKLTRPDPKWPETRKKLIVFELKLDPTWTESSRTRPVTWQFFLSNLPDPTRSNPNPNPTWPIR
jgi:hypothetical protein